MNQSKSFGASLRLLRKSKMLSLVQLSEQSGVSNPYLSQIENDKFVPSLEILRKLATALDSDLYELAIEAGIYSEEDLAMLKRNTRKNTFADEDFTYEAYKSHYHVQLEDIMKDSGRSFYIAGHKLNDNELQALVQIFEGKEKNYPTEQQLKADYEKLK
ncbi:helix-turn-helix domain-containing protein [Lysinibacillus sp. LZ02]|uniref:helix-turn-helix domain-containing protein n=1 Tax=Lysinibacillus sp. LZ02 TaxID=3420668 RepID=UPI003D362186